jgi:hypothetical protein
MMMGMYSVFGVVLKGMCSVNKSNSLSEIPRRRTCIIDALNFHQHLVLVLLVMGSSETEEHAFHPKPVITLK